MATQAGRRRRPAGGIWSVVAAGLLAFAESSTLCCIHSLLQVITAFCESVIIDLSNETLRKTAATVQHEMSVAGSQKGGQRFRYTHHVVLEHHSSSRPSKKRSLPLPTSAPSPSPSRVPTYFPPVATVLLRLDCCRQNNGLCRFEAARGEATRLAPSLPSLALQSSLLRPWYLSPIVLSSPRRW